MRLSSAMEWTALSSVVIGCLLQRSCEGDGSSPFLIRICASHSADNVQTWLGRVALTPPPPPMAVNSPHDPHANQSTNVLLVHIPSPSGDWRLNKCAPTSICRRVQWSS
ncbi:hypothetical protein CEXT_782421 [Caerostris extrusa]|uniref:Secreted protein n=1 Tax=Caerostris extrusa TaxID=172846 RepID=A0AAV4MHN5_CAEEX|nr:hypothetical protein CEXT_782421 [Caerostris extrusa]